MDLVELLKEYKFINTNISNEYIKSGKRYKLVLWANGKITLIHYTPKYGRFLDSKTYENVTEFEQYLKINF